MCPFNTEMPCIDWPFHSHKWYNIIIAKIIGTTLWSISLLVLVQSCFHLLNWLDTSKGLGKDLQNVWGLDTFVEISKFCYLFRNYQFISILYDALSTYGAHFSLKHLWKTPLISPREGEVWGVVRECKSGRRFTIAIVVLCALSCYIWPLYIANLHCWID